MSIGAARRRVVYSCQIVVDGNRDVGIGPGAG